MHITSGSLGFMEGLLSVFYSWGLKSKTIAIIGQTGNIITVYGTMVNLNYRNLFIKMHILMIFLSIKECI